MALLPILHYPDPRLRRIARPVERVDDTVRALVRDMADTMYEAPGIGLAAVQVDQLVRVVVIDISEGRNELQVLINPEILDRQGTREMDEGCLSVPGIYDTVERADRVKVRALDLDGQPFELDVDGLLATCIQHEVDHLDGKIFVDYLSRLKQSRIRKKLEKQQHLAM